MIVYLDLLILDNFCADAALLYCAVRTVKGEVRWLRIALTAALGAALGTGYAVFTLYYTLPAAVGFIVRWGVLFVLPLPAGAQGEDPLSISPTEKTTVQRSPFSMGIPPHRGQNGSVFSEQFIKQDVSFSRSLGKQPVSFV